MLKEPREGIEDRRVPRSRRTLMAAALAFFSFGSLPLLSVSCSREEPDTVAADATSSAGSVGGAGGEIEVEREPRAPSARLDAPESPPPEHLPDPPTGEVTGAGASPPDAVATGRPSDDRDETPPPEPASEPGDESGDSFTSPASAPEEGFTPARAAASPRAGSPDTRPPGKPADPPRERSGDQVPAYRVEQVTEGVPDPRPGMPPREELQVLTVSRDGQRIVLDKFSLPERSRTGEERSVRPRLLERYILRLDRDPPVLWLEAPDGSWYEEHHGDLTKIQRERRVRELQTLAKLKDYSRKEREAILRLNHLRPEGEREVTVEWGETREVLGKECRRLIVEENDRVIIDSLISEDLAGGRGFFDLYSRLGAFSPEVLEKIRDVRGLPLAGSITVVTKLTAHPFRFEVKEFEEVTMPEDVFARPQGKKREPQGDDIRCAHCGKRGEPDRMEFLRFQGPKHFCDTECKRKFLEERFGQPRVPEKAK